HAEVMGEALRRMGHVCTIVHDKDAAVEELKHGNFDLVVTDLVMDTPQDGMDILEAARQHQPDAETILVTAHGDVPTCKAALKKGAYDFIEKPLDLDVFRTLCSHALQAVMLRAETQNLRGQIEDQFGPEGIIGSSPSIRRVIQQIRQIAPSHIPVLITGESGTGKELVAHALHNLSKRAKARFVPLNCAGLSESILEDELFGHVRGAFTGAEREREGRFEYADKGTLFLDEVGDMPLTMQAKLLRVLESGEVVRVGSNEPRHVDVRLISATNRDLATMTKESSFREDLFFRIKGAQIHIPALRERPEDVPVLAEHYARVYAQQADKPAPRFTEETLRALMHYAWPGNVRQLMNVVQNMVIVADADRLEPRDLPAEIVVDQADAASFDVPAGMSLEQIEKQAIRNALRVNKGNREATAKMLNIGQRTLYRKLKEYGLK
ncbi:MAG: sigma-54-dependent Fis family transcriptional regulator, partial [Phycisphaeraceae bacterium]|nr:sigma-54-dependent Fis family transcriptional regulator [Phycisphaeraceae bacterium]